MNKDGFTLSVLMLFFFSESFQLLVEQTKLYYQQHSDRKVGRSRRLPDVTLLDMITFITLA